jgi:hypothetical protein
MFNLVFHDEEFIKKLWESLNFTGSYFGLSVRLDVAFALANRLPPFFFLLDLRPVLA